MRAKRDGNTAVAVSCFHPRDVLTIKIVGYERLSYQEYWESNAEFALTRPLRACWGGGGSKVIHSTGDIRAATLIHTVRDLRGGPELLYGG